MKTFDDNIESLKQDKNYRNQSKKIVTFEEKKKTQYKEKELD